MSAYDVEIPGRQPFSLVGTAWSATFAADVAAVGDPADVLIPAFGDDAELKFGPCTWMPRTVAPLTFGVDDLPVTLEYVLPAKGDPCLVVFDEQTRPWIVCWEPA